MIYVMSDIHGRFDKYQQMLKTVEFGMSDTLYVLGDMIDRGPDGIRILQDMNMRPNVIPILGNHEFTAAVCLSWLMEEITDLSVGTLREDQIGAFSEWLTNGGEPTLQVLQQLSQEEREDILDYIREMELYAEVDAGGRSFVLVHAGLRGFSPDKPLSAYQLDDFLFDRPNVRQTYFEDKFLVFGHTPVRRLRELMGEAPSDQILRCGNQIAIDCGCELEGGRLGCLCLDTLEEFYT